MATKIIEIIKVGNGWLIRAPGDDNYAAIALSLAAVAETQETLLKIVEEWSAEPPPKKGK